MTIAWILIVIVALIECFFLFQTFLWSCALAERELELDKQEVSLTEREERNTEDFLALADMEGDKEFSVVYCVSEADEMRYTTEAAIARNAKKHLAFTIANDIVHTFEPEVSEDGKKFSYKLRVTDEIRTA